MPPPRDATLRLDRAAGDAAAPARPPPSWAAIPSAPFEPGASKSVKLSYNAKSEGPLKMEALASDPCAGATRVVAQTMIKTIPALMLEAVDKSDPVRVGENTTYTINVKTRAPAPTRTSNSSSLSPRASSTSVPKAQPAQEPAGQKLTFSAAPHACPRPNRLLDGRD